MALEFGVVDPEHQQEYRDAVAVGFGQPAHEKPEPLPVVELDRNFGAREDGRYVGGTAAYTKQITPAGPAEPIAMCAVSNVAVMPTHTRMGVTTTLMGLQLDQAVERGESVATLMASEATIYGRFGFGMGSRSVSMKIRSADAHLREGAAAGGRVHLVPPGEGRHEVLPPSWEVFRRSMPGELDRSAAWWSVVLGDDEEWIGGGKQFVAVHEPEGGGPVDGHCRYSLKGNWADGRSEATIFVTEMAAADPAVELALWQHCLTVDLTTTVECWRRPERDLLIWSLVDTRARTTTGAGDNIWVRLLDVPVAMEARGYSGEGSVVLDVHDPFRPDTGGRFQLDAGVDGATCKRTDAEPDLALGVDALGALWLGGFWPSALAAAGRIEERRDGALAVADRLVPMAKSPLLQTPF